jgi:hypothetical protein
MAGCGGRLSLTAIGETQLRGVLDTSGRERRQNRLEAIQAMVTCLVTLGLFRGGS